MSLPYSLVETGNVRNITVFVDGEILVADDSHENFDKIVAAARAGDTKIADLFSVEKTVTIKFQALSERVTVENGVIYFDGEAVHNSLADQVMRFLQEGEDFAPLVNFWEKLGTNPSEHSREQLYSWLSAEKFTITPEGDILGYKGLNDNLTSIHSGAGFINGVAATGHLDNSVGNVVTIARSEVVADSFASCAYGLHVGTFEYASTFGNKTVEVVVNPRDVVSVPTDCGGAKMRVCRYKVSRLASGKIDKAVAPGSTDTRENHKRLARDSRGRFLSKV